MVKINIERMKEHLDSETINVPIGLSREEKRNLIMLHYKQIDMFKPDIPKQEKISNWVDDNDAWVSGHTYENEDGIWISGISTGYWGHIIECYGSSEKEVNDFAQFIFDALKHYEYKEIE